MNKVPDEVLLIIFETIAEYSNRDLRSCRKVCRKWNSIIKEEPSIKDKINLPLITHYFRLMDKKEAKMIIDNDKKALKNYSKFLGKYDLWMKTGKKVLFCDIPDIILIKY